MCGWTCVGRPSSSARRLSRDWIVRTERRRPLRPRKSAVSSAFAAFTSSPRRAAQAAIAAGLGPDRDDARLAALAEHADLAGRDIGEAIHIDAIEFGQTQAGRIEKVRRWPGHGGPAGRRRSARAGRSPVRRQRPQQGLGLFGGRTPATGFWGASPCRPSQR